MDEMDIVLMGELIGLATVILLAIIGIVAIRFHLKKRELLSREIITAIEKGVDVPLPEPKVRNYRNLGLIWTFLGVAFTIALFLSSREIAAAVWGLLPLALGIAFLLIHKSQAEQGS